MQAKEEKKGGKSKQIQAAKASSKSGGKAKKKVFNFFLFVNFKQYDFD